MPIDCLILLKKLANYDILQIYYTSAVVANVDQNKFYKFSVQKKENFKPWYTKLI